MMRFSSLFWWCSICTYRFRPDIVNQIRYKAFTVRSNRFASPQKWMFIDETVSTLSAGGGHSTDIKSVCCYAYCGSCVVCVCVLAWYHWFVWPGWDIWLLFRRILGGLFQSMMNDHLDGSSAFINDDDDGGGNSGPVACVGCAAVCYFVRVFIFFCECHSRFGLFVFFQ